MNVLNIRDINNKWTDNMIYIGRKNVTWNMEESKWHNPWVCGVEHIRGTTLALYEDYIRNNEELWNSLDELDGRSLVCWCKPKPCHADILIKLLNEKKMNDIFNL